MMMEGGLCAPSEHPLVMGLDISTYSVLVFSHCQLIDTVMNNCRSGNLNIIQFLSFHICVDAKQLALGPIISEYMYICSLPVLPM